MYVLPLLVISTAAQPRSAPSSRPAPAPIEKRRRRRFSGDMKRLEVAPVGRTQRKRETRGKECALKRRERCFWAGVANAAAGGNASAANALDWRRPPPSVSARTSNEAAELFFIVRSGCGRRRAAATPRMRTTSSRKKSYGGKCAQRRKVAVAVCCEDPDVPSLAGVGVEGVGGGFGHR
jgi:hypothetical protein